MRETRQGTDIDEVLRYYNEGYSVKEVAHMVGRTRWAISLLLRKYKDGLNGLPASQAYDEAAEAAAMELVEMRASILHLLVRNDIAHEDIMRITNCTQAQLKAALAELDKFVKLGGGE
jgi:transposase